MYWRRGKVKASMNGFVETLKKVTACIGLLLLCTLAPLRYAHAAAPPANNPQSGSVGVTGVLPSAPPTKGATIAVPTNGQTFTSIPITVSGLCPDGLLVKVFDNNVFMGSVVCTGGSYSLKIDLFSGQNDLVARVYDSLDQAGPDSNVVVVTFNDSQFNTSGSSLLMLTSDYARRGANPGAALVWPIILSGGTGPYAISTDWGDNKPADLLSVQFPGVINLQHVYDTAGVYNVIIKATDKNGLTAYLQVVAVANGAITSSASSNKNNTQVITKTNVLWLPAAIMLPFILISFWLGKKHELLSLRRHLQRSNY